jgi:hypothetical protein
MPELEIAKRSCDCNTVRVGTLTWSGDAAEKTYLTSDEFTRTLALVSSHVHPQTDLILCAGRRVIYSRSEDELSPRRIVSHTGGTPIVFEWYAEAKNGDEIGQWWLVGSDHGRPDEYELRSEQIVRRSIDDPIKFVRVASTIANGDGVITVRDTPLRLVLLICGENNCLKTSGRGSALRGWVRRRIDRDALRQFLGGPWVALNPAHRPYFPITVRRGAGNICGFDGERAFFARLVDESNEQRSDGTTAPVAIVHTNTFLPERPRTVELSSLVFSRFSRRSDRKLRPSARPFPRDLERGRPMAVIEWRYAEYVVRWV